MRNAVGRNNPSVIRRAHTPDDTSPCAGEVFGLSRASRRARNARRSKLCSAPTAKTGAPALAGATPPAVGAAACPRPAAVFFFKLNGSANSQFLRIRERFSVFHTCRTGDREGRPYGENGSAGA